MKQLLIMAVMMTAATTTSLSQERLQGDAAAVDRIEVMLERLGGAEVWARTRTLHLQYHGWRIEPNSPVVEHAWRDLTEPSEYIIFKGRSFKFERVFSPESGWVARDNEVRVMDVDRHKTSVDFWPKDFYTMIRRFAVADQSLRLRFVEPRRVEVDNSDDENLGWWIIDSTGQPMVWGTMDEGEKLEYVYLPVKDFGVVNFPAGGAATDGFWRFEYDMIDVSIDAIPVSLEAPDNRS